MSQGLPRLMQGSRSLCIERAGGDAGAVYCTLITAKLVHQQLKVPQEPRCSAEHVEDACANLILESMYP